MQLRLDDLARTLERSAGRIRERQFDSVGTREAYDRWAEVYDQRHNPLIVLEDREMPSVVGDVSGLEVLDAGCGTGRWTEKLSRGGARVTAVDFSAEMLSQARRRVDEPVQFVEHDLERPLPFPDRSFDLVVSALVVEHLRELQGVFDELARVCRRGGRVVLSAMHPAIMLLGCQAEFADPRSGRDVRPQSYPHQIADFIMAGLRAGLTVDHVSEYEVDEDLKEKSPTFAMKFAGWPFLLLLGFRA